MVRYHFISHSEAVTSASRSSAEALLKFGPSALYCCRSAVCL